MLNLAWHALVPTLHLTVTHVERLCVWALDSPSELPVASKTSIMWIVKITRNSDMMQCVRGRPATVQVRSSAFPAAPEEASSSAQIEEVSQEELAAAKVKRICTAYRHFSLSCKETCLY